MERLMANSSYIHITAAAALLFFAGLGCDDGTTTIGAPIDAAGGCEGAACDDGGGGDGGGGGGGDTDPEATVTAIEIEPSTVTLISENGAKPEQEFNVMALYSDGRRELYRDPVEFSIASERIGYIDPANGRFVAHGIVGGQTEITATPIGGSADQRPVPANATIEVYLKRTVMGDGVPADVEQSFTGAQVTDPTRAADIVYPLEGAVMPENVYPADIQWLNGAQDDLFQVRLTKPSAEVVAYLKHSGVGFGNHWLADQDAWRSMAQTEQGEPMAIAVTRLEATSGEVIGSESVNIRFDKGTIAGSVYYWDIGAGRIVRINDGTATREQFMPSPPESATGGDSCVGCHSVSNSGRYMVGRLGGGDNIGAVFDLTEDLTQDPVPTEFGNDPGGERWWFSTWSPDDSRLIITQGNGATSRMSLLDPFTGQLIQPVDGALPTGGITYPAWSPDGSLIAYIANSNSWGDNVTAGDVAVVPVTGADSFGPAQIIRAGTDIPNPVPAGQAPSYPTWSPDSQWLAFAHGSGSRSESMQSALYMMGRDGTELVRLDNASGGVNADNTFQPNFSPFETEDYFWLSYLSRRDYGNAQQGTRGASRQQIWVSAVSKSPTGAQDASEVGFWLPGQNTESMNIAAFWAPRACRQDGEGCSVGGECCSGECLPDEGQNLVCSPPPPDRCRELTETCSSSADCCGSLLCAANVCYPSDG
jgi:WD40 repeat protein